MRGRRRELARGREERAPGLAGLGLLHAPADAGHRLVRLALRLLGHPLPEEGHDRPPDQGAADLALLARDDARRVRRPRLGGAAVATRRPARSAASARGAAGQARGEGGRDRRGAPGPAPRRWEHPDRVHVQPAHAGPRPRRAGRRRGRAPEPRAQPDLHRLELRAGAERDRSRALPWHVSQRARRRGLSGRRARPHRPAVRHAGSRRRRAPPLPDAPPGRDPPAVRAALRAGAPRRRPPDDALRGGDRARDVAAADGGLPVRRAARQTGRRAARRLRAPDEARVLPALRGRDGAHAPLRRHPRAGRGRLHERLVRPGPPHVDGDRPRRAHLGRSVVPRLRLAAVRPDPGAREPLVALLGLVAEVRHLHGRAAALARGRRDGARSARLQARHGIRRA